MKNCTRCHMSKEPLVSFDLSDRSQFIEAAHYSNYQPPVEVG
jgi:hypothetical protein